MFSTSDVPTMTKNQFDRSPVITSDGGGDKATITIDAGDTGVTTVIASQQGNGRFFYSLDGADAALFSINSKTGVLSFRSAAVAGTYNLVVVVTGRGGLTDTQAITVEVEAGGGLSALYSLNFLTTTYEHNGSPVALNTILERNADLGPFDSATDINASGLSPVPSAEVGVYTSPAFVQSVAAALLTSGFTAVLDMSFTGLTPNIGSIVMQAVRLPDFEAYLDFDVADAGGSLTLLERYNDGDTPDYDSAGDMNIGDGSHRIAYTVHADGAQAISVDGGSIVTLAAFTPSPSLTDLYMTIATGTTESGARRTAIEQLTIYAAQDDTDLPTLSTP